MKSKKVAVEMMIEDIVTEHSVWTAVSPKAAIRPLVCELFEKMPAAEEVTISCGDTIYHYRRVK